MAASQVSHSANTNIEPGNESDLVLASASNKGRPYGPGTQLLVIGVHGTNNGPGNVSDVTSRIGSAMSNNANVGKTLIDTGFDWQPLSGTTNQTEHREIAAQQLTARTLTTLDEAYKTGALDRNKPLVIVYAGFSHGGNVALLASDETALGLKQRGITNAGVHIASMSTPAYTWGEENPAFAAREVKKNGVSFAHTHFSVPGDGVIRGAAGDNDYPGPGNDDSNKKLRIGVTTNITLPEYSRGEWDSGIKNHGAPQDSDSHMNTIANTMSARFRGLAPPAQQRADASDNIEIASAKISTLEDSKHAYNKQFSMALNGLDSINMQGDKKDIAAALVQAGANAGFDKDGSLKVVVGTKDNVIAVQGDGATALRASVLHAEVQPGALQNVSDSLAKQASLQVAVLPVDQVEQSKGRSIS